MTMIRDYEIERWENEAQVPVIDTTVCERPLTLHVNGREWTTLLCSPGDEQALATGFLFGTGVITGPQQIKQFCWDKTNWAAYVELQNKELLKDLFERRVYTSCCGMGTIFYRSSDLLWRSQKIHSELTLSQKEILAIMDQFQQASSIFRQTGGVHSAALVKIGELFLVKEDIGRHNAIDKVVGTALLDGTDLSTGVLCTSGRVTSETIFKLQKARIPIVLSRSAPTDQAINAARQIDLTLIGFVRGSRMNLYSGLERVSSCRS